MRPVLASCLVAFFAAGSVCLALRETSHDLMTLLFQ
jgi:hypothetical protein